MCGQCGGDSDSEYDDPSEVNREAIEAFLTGGSKAVAIGLIASQIEEAGKESDLSAEKALGLLRSDFAEIATVIPEDDGVRHQRLRELLKDLENRRYEDSSGRNLWSGLSEWGSQSNLNVKN